MFDTFIKVITVNYRANDRNNIVFPRRSLPRNGNENKCILTLAILQKHFCRTLETASDCYSEYLPSQEAHLYFFILGLINNNLQCTMGKVDSKIFSLHKVQKFSLINQNCLHQRTPPRRTSKTLKLFQGCPVQTNSKLQRIICC